MIGCSSTRALHLAYTVRLRLLEDRDMKRAWAIGAMFIAATFGIHAQHQGDDAAKQSQATASHHAMSHGAFVHIRSHDVDAP